MSFGGCTHLQNFKQKISRTWTVLNEYAYLTEQDIMEISFKISMTNLFEFFISGYVISETINSIFQTL